MVENSTEMMQIAQEVFIELESLITTHIDIMQFAVLSFAVISFVKVVYSGLLFKIIMIIALFMGSTVLIVSIMYNTYELKYIPYFLFTITIIVSTLIAFFYVFYDKIKTLIHKIILLIINNKYSKKVISYIKETISIVNEELKNKNNID